MQEVSPPLDKRGFALFFTGLSGSGKTTITAALIETVQSLLPTRQMTILDGDVVRTHLSRELGFSVKVCRRVPGSCAAFRVRLPLLVRALVSLQDRNTNVARMGWVAAEVVRHGGIAICSTISPFHESRQAARELVEATNGGFVLIHVSTSVDECAARDVKGLYEKAKRGDLNMTGVSHPYEYPEIAELTIDAGVVPVQTSVDVIIGAAAWASLHRCRCVYV